MILLVGLNPGSLPCGSGFRGGNIAHLGHGRKFHPISKMFCFTSRHIVGYANVDNFITLTAHILVCVSIRHITNGLLSYVTPGSDIAAAHNLRRSRNLYTRAFQRKVACRNDMCFEIGLPSKEFAPTQAICLLCSLFAVRNTLIQILLTRFALPAPGCSATDSRPEFS